MNVLPIVFSILMLLAIMTYSQLQNFLLRSTVRLEYTCYLENRSRNTLNLLQEKLYDEHHTLREKKEEQSGRNSASSKINIHWFLDEPKDDQEWQFRQANDEIVRRLFDVIYANRKFYQEAGEKRPDIVNELWQTIINKLQEMKTGKELPGRIEHIENLPLGDPELSEFLSHLLMPVETPESIQSTCPSKEVKDVQKNVSFYPNILDFLTKQTGSSKAYRLWLLKKPLLLAIFQDEATVDEIMKERSSLYNTLNSAPKNQREPLKQELSVSFETMFKNKIPHDIPDGTLNFQVSLSRPPK